MSRFQEIVEKALVHWIPNQKILVNHRPDWLFGMELDFYFPALKFAVEVQGRQHYKLTEAFHASRKELHLQRQRDVRKRQICKRRGVQIMVVRYNGKGQIWGLGTKLHKFMGIVKTRLPKQILREWKLHKKTMHAVSAGKERAAKEHSMSLRGFINMMTDLRGRMS